MSCAVCEPGKSCKEVMAIRTANDGSPRTTKKNGTRQKIVVTYLCPQCGRETEAKMYQFDAGVQEHLVRGLVPPLYANGEVGLCALCEAKKSGSESAVKSVLRKQDADAYKDSMKRTGHAALMNKLKGK
jgi:hypothetical protein